jgi:hypothetical protein
MLCGRAGSVRTARRARACGWVCRAVSRAVRRTPRQSCCCCGRRRRAVRAGGARPGRGGGATAARTPAARVPGGAWGSWRRCGGCVVQCAAGCGALSLRSRSRAAPDPACRRWRSCRRRPPGRRRWLPGRGCAPPPAPPPEPPFSSPSAPLLLSPPPQPPATSRNVPQPPGTSRNLPERPATSRNVPHSPAAFLRRPEAVPVEPHPGIRSVCSRQHPLVRTGHKPLRRAIACTSTRRAAPAGAAGVCK